MPLKLTLRPDEKFILNGVELQNGHRRGVLLVNTEEAAVVREDQIMSTEERDKSDLHTLAYEWFLHLSGLTVLTHEQCWDLSEKCMAYFQDDETLRSMQLEFRWFPLYKRILRSLREGV